MWFIKFDFVPKILLHSVHLCLRIRRCTVIIWAFKADRFVNDFSQSVQWISRIVLCVSSWRFKSLGDLNDTRQFEHGYLRWSVWVNLCDFKLLDFVKNAEQISHWKRLDVDDAVENSLLLCLRWCIKSLFDVMNSREQT